VAKGTAESTAKATA
jgi:hypothetical protein